MNNMIIIFLFSVITCSNTLSKTEFIFYFPNEIITCVRNNIDSTGGVSKFQIIPDSIYTLSEQNEKHLLLVTAGTGSNITGLFYLLREGNSYELVHQIIDPLTIFNLEVYFYDITEDCKEEIVTLWIHEGDTYFITVDRIFDDTVINLFRSADLSVPWNGKEIISSCNDTLYFYCQNPNGDGHKKIKLKFNKSGNLELEKVD